MDIFNIATSQLDKTTIIEDQVITFDNELNDKFFDNVKFINVTFMKCSFTLVSFFNCTFRNVKFIDCKFTDCNFKTCVMSDIKVVSTSIHACFEYSRISRTTFRHIKGHISASFTTVNICEILYSHLEINISHSIIAFIRSYTNQMMYHINWSTIYSAISFSTHYDDSVIKLSDVTNIIYKKCTLSVLCTEDSALKKVKFIECCINSIYATNTSFAKVLSKNTAISTRDIETSTLDKETSNSLFTEDAKGFIAQQAIIGYKKVSSDYAYVILKLEIPKGAVVFSINGSKCRTNKAKVLEIASKNVPKNTRMFSTFDAQFIYEVGKTYEIPDFDTRYNIECSSGIHFFKTIEEAKYY